VVGSGSGWVPSTHEVRCRSCGGRTGKNGLLSGAASRAVRELQGLCPSSSGTQFVGLFLTIKIDSVRVAQLEEAHVKKIYVLSSTTGFPCVDVYGDTGHLQGRIPSVAG
jgi:hypothetical protein